MDLCIDCKNREYYFKKNGVCPIEVDKCLKKNLSHVLSRLGNFGVENCNQFEPTEEYLKKKNSYYQCFHEGFECVWGNDECANPYHEGEWVTK